MADTGLQNIKLQDGYVKLLHTKGNAGVNDYVSQVGTSNGPNIVGTPLYLGVDGDTQNNNPMVKLKAIEGNAKPFLIITDSLGTFNSGTDEYPILTFYSDGSLSGTDYWGPAMNGSHGVWNGRCMFDFSSGGNRGGVEFMCDSNIHGNVSHGDGNSSFPNIRKHSVNNNVMFAQPYSASGTTTFWQFDRVKIAADIGPSNQGSGEVSFEADGVPATWGTLLADGYYLNVDPEVSAAAGKKIDVNALGTINFAGTGNMSFELASTKTFDVYGGKEIVIDADGAGLDSVGSVITIDAFRKEDGSGTSDVKIGTEDTKSRIGVNTVTGTQSVWIGNAGVVGNSYVNANTTFLQSKNVVVDSGMIVLGTALNTWNQYDDVQEAPSGPSDYGALFFQDSDESVSTHSDWGRQLFLYDDDAATGVLYTIDKLQTGKSRVLELRDCAQAASLTTPPAVTSLPEGTAQIYVKNKKFIIAYHDADEATDFFYSFPLDGETDALALTYSASEPT